MERLAGKHVLAGGPNRAGPEDRFELAPANVQVNALCPGWVATDMAWEGLEGMAAATGTTREAAHAEAMKAVPLGRMGEPEDVAGTVAWLLSPDARGVTGQAIDQNGGAFMS